MSSFFTLPICSRWSDTVEILTSSVSDISLTPTWALFDNCFQTFSVESAWSLSTFFYFKTLITTTEFLKPPSYCSITSGSFSPCSVDIGGCLGSWNSCKKSKRISSFFIFVIKGLLASKLYSEINYPKLFKEFASVISRVTFWGPINRKK